MHNGTSRRVLLDVVPGATLHAKLLKCNYFSRAFNPFALVLYLLSVVRLLRDLCYSVFCQKGASSSSRYCKSLRSLKENYNIRLTWRAPALLCFALEKELGSRFGCRCRKWLEHRTWRAKEMKVGQIMGSKVCWDGFGKTRFRYC